MSRKLFIAGNWKMNTSLADGCALAKGLAERLGSAQDVDLGVAPPFVYLASIKDALAGSSIALGAQNMFYEDDGKFYVDSDAEGDAFVTLDFVCLSCHNGTDASKQDMAWAAATFKGVHEVATPVAEVATAETPTTYELSQNSPNPFNPETWLTYELPSQTRVVMTVYSLSGQKVRTLVDEDHTQGRYSVSWDGKDDFGGAVASGVYLCRMDAGTFASVRKMTLLR